MFVVDTNVISAAAPTKSSKHVALLDWMERNSESLFVSVVTIAEVEDGIAKAAREGAKRKASALAEWLETLLHLYSSRILVLDASVARVVGRLSDLARGRGHDPGFADLIIAATALTRGYAVLTRNLRHFSIVDVRAHNPFDQLP